MLAPLDAVKGNTLLDEFPQRAQLPEECDSFLNRLQNVVDLTLRGKPSDSEPDATVGTLVTAAECSQDITRFQRSGGTCTSRR